MIPPCLTLSIIRYGSRVKWSNPGNGVAPSPTPWCSSYRKGSLRVTPRLWSLTLLTYIYIYWQHFFINTNFVEHNWYFLSTYFLVDPFILPYCFYRIRQELINAFSSPDDGPKSGRKYFVYVQLCKIHQ